MKYINVYVSVNYFQSERENFLRFAHCIYGELNEFDFIFCGVTTEQFQRMNFSLKNCIVSRRFINTVGWSFRVSIFRLLYVYN